MKKVLSTIIVILLLGATALATVVNHAGNPWFLTGLSSDTKPVKAPPGSIYRATDTGIMYRWQPTLGWIALIPLGMKVPWTLDDLTNVSAPTPTNGYILRANGSSWNAEPNLASNISTSVTSSLTGTTVQVELENLSNTLSSLVSTSTPSDQHVTCWKGSVLSYCTTSISTSGTCSCF